jgi:hypothetical protein
MQVVANGVLRVSGDREDKAERDGSGITIPPYSLHAATIFMPLKS